MNEKSELIGRIQYLITKDSKNKSQILRELHLSTSTLSDWEKGKGNPSTSAIMKLARYFNVSSDYILFGTANNQNIELSPSENKWLQIYHMFTDTEKEELLDTLNTPSDIRDIMVWISFFSQLSMPEREICAAFIHGVLAEKKLKEMS